MIEANSESCNREGQKDDLRMEDLAPLCTMEEAAGFAVDDMFEATPLAFLILTIVAAIKGTVELLALSGCRQNPRPTHEAAI